MSSQKVWSRFEGKKKDGSSTKRFRIEDLPPERVDEVIDLMATYYARDETVLKAVGVTSNPASMESYIQFLNLIYRDPACRVVICCEDVEGPQKIVGVSAVAEVQDDEDEGRRAWDEVVRLFKEDGTEESEKLIRIFYEASQNFDAIKEYHLNKYYRDRYLVVHPDYRGYGLAVPLLTVRRLMCEAHGIPLTGGWMTAFGTQVAAARDGWKVVTEVQLEEAAKKHDLTFTDAPPTIKYMVAGPLLEKLQQ